MGKIKFVSILACVFMLFGLMSCGDSEEIPQNYHVHTSIFSKDFMKYYRINIVSKDSQGQRLKSLTETTAYNTFLYNDTDVKCFMFYTESLTSADVKYDLEFSVKGNIVDEDIDDVITLVWGVKDRVMNSSIQTKNIAEEIRNCDIISLVNFNIKRYAENHNMTKVEVLEDYVKSYKDGQISIWGTEKEEFGNENTDNFD